MSYNFSILYHFNRLYLKRNSLINFYLRLAYPDYKNHINITTSLNKLIQSTESQMNITASLNKLIRSTESQMNITASLNKLIQSTESQMNITSSLNKFMPSTEIQMNITASLEKLIQSTEFQMNITASLNVFYWQKPTKHRYTFWGMTTHKYTVGYSQVMSFLETLPTDCL